MEHLKHILTLHAQRYPKMRPQDAVKLLYQHQFGPGHLVKDPASALKRLCDEWAQTPPDSAVPLFEDIGNNLVRVMLPAWSSEEYPAETLNNDFIRSAHVHNGNQASFLTELVLLQELTEQNLFSFSLEELNEFLQPYIAAGFPAVSHSEEYRQAYHPAYRVVRRDCLSVSPVTVILKEIKKRRHTTRPLLIAIDGRCASGKTTLSSQLQQACGCGVVHMDDFFLRPEQRTQKRYDTPGENVDHERFLEEMLLPLHQGQAAVYRPFDCSTQQFSDPIRLEPLPVVVVEGSYSCHPSLWPYYDLTVFLSLPSDQQMQRIIQRDGETYAKVFADKWIPLEETYFAQRRLDQICDFSFPCGFAAPQPTDR